MGQLEIAHDFLQSVGALLPSDPKSLQYSIAKTLGLHVAKDDALRRNGWTAWPLPQSKVDYAVLDAWLAVEVISRATSGNLFGLAVTSTTPDGTSVAFTPSGSTTVHALGCLRASPSNNEVGHNGRRVRVTPNRRCVTFEHVIVPGYRLSSYHRLLRDFGPVPFNLVVDLAELVTHSGYHPINPRTAEALASVRRGVCVSPALPRLWTCGL